MRMRIGSLIRRRPNAAMIVAIIALVAAVGGTAVAGGGFLPKKKFKHFKRGYANTTGIFASHKEGPVNLPSSATTISSLTVPRGNFAINAKLYTDTTGTDEMYTCQLVANGIIDESRSGNGVDSGEKQTNIVLQGVQSFSNGGNIQVQCQDDNASETTDVAKFIKITAIRSRSLSNVNG